MTYHIRNPADMWHAARKMPAVLYDEWIMALRFVPVDLDKPNGQSLADYPMVNWGEAEFERANKVLQLLQQEGATDERNECSGDEQGS